MKAKVTTRFTTIMKPIEVRGDMIGEVFCYLGDKLVGYKKNTIQTAFLQETAKGAGTGSGYWVDTLRFIASGPVTLATENTSVAAGGDGTVNYTTWTATYTNSSGSSKIVDVVQLRDSAGDHTFSEVDITDVTVPDTETFTVDWKITFSTNDDLTTLYLNETMEGVAQSGGGNYDYVPNKMGFCISAAYEAETATLVDGGDGTEVYHEWQASHTADGAETVTALKLWDTIEADTLVDVDITDRSLANGDTLVATIRITHAVA